MTAYSIIAIAVASFLLAHVLVLTASRHGRFTMDVPGSIQAFHSEPTPRVGGVGIYCALLLVLPFVAEAESGRILNNILIAGLPALGIGLLEDITKRVGVAVRLLVTVCSGVLACWLGGVVLHRVEVPLIDGLLQIQVAGLLFTAFAVAGVTNAINIIDGFNGLASGTTSIGLIAIATIAALVGDMPLALACAAMTAAIAGFWLVNFPWGKLFLGDGGAYFAGFALAWLAVLLPVRNPSVSPWASLLICAYPIVEVLYSVARRHRLQAAPSQADRQHLHSLVATRFIQRRMPNVKPVYQNSAVSVLMWFCAAIPALAAVTFYRDTSLLMICATAGLLLYHWLYRLVSRI